MAVVLPFQSDIKPSANNYDKQAYQSPGGKMRELQKTLRDCGVKKERTLFCAHAEPPRLSVWEMFPRCPLGGRSAPGVPTSPLSALRDGEHTPEFTEETEPRGGRQLVSPRDRKRENPGPRRRGHSASQALSPLDVEWRKRVISPSHNCRGPVGVQTAQGIPIKPRAQRA